MAHKSVRDQGSQGSLAPTAPSSCPRASRLTVGNVDEKLRALDQYKPLVTYDNLAELYTKQKLPGLSFTMPCAVWSRRARGRETSLPLWGSTASNFTRLSSRTAGLNAKAATGRRTWDWLAPSAGHRNMRSAS